MIQKRVFTITMPDSLRQKSPSDHDGNTGSFNFMGQIARFLSGLGSWVTQTWHNLRPHSRTWSGAGLAMFLGAMVLQFIFLIQLFSPLTQPLPLLGGMLVGAVIALCIGAAISFVIWLLKRVPLLFGLLTVASIPPIMLTLFTLLIGQAVTTSLVAIAVFVVLLILLGGGLGVVFGQRDGWRQLTRRHRTFVTMSITVSSVGLISFTLWLLDDGTSVTVPIDAWPGQTQVEPLALADPSRQGEYPVRTLTYGSGTDLHRPEFGYEVDLVTDPVDGSSFIEWDGLTAWDRSRFWGFDAERLPRNGRVWYPDWSKENGSKGDGEEEERSPLVLIVHGNHPMQDFSDEGYGYLGEMLASRGYVVASIDENFLNLSWSDIFDGLGSENDARGWLLLEHLQLWREWSVDATSPFFQRVDLDRVALVGHSRGGEAVAIAAAFNKLKHYPDDANQRFEYGFGIRTLIAIAPVDGHYQPAGIGTTLEGIDYLVVHGAQDMDVVSFAGMDQYERINLGKETHSTHTHFKAAVYIWGANHGQFNTTWGRFDLPQPGVRLLNVKQLLTGDEQRQIMRVLSGAFLDASLKKERAYLPLFYDLWRGAEWLPETTYVNRFADSTVHHIAAYGEDIDLTTASIDGAFISGRDLSIWREQPIGTKWGENDDNRVVYLGWNRQNSVPSYTITLPDNFIVGKADTLTVALADADEILNVEQDIEKHDATGNEAKDGPKESIRLTVEVTDRTGEVARLPLVVQGQLQPTIGKLNADWFDTNKRGEPILQTYALPLTDFVAQNNALNSEIISSIRFLFNSTEAATLVLDEVGLATWK
ncbi:MAG: hypothetical protein AAF702_47680 [Chloroflexota bacterium]